MSAENAEEMKSEPLDHSRTVGDWRNLLRPEDYFLDNIKIILKNGAFKSGVHYLHEITVNTFIIQIEKIQRLSQDGTIND